MGEARSKRETSAQTIYHHTSTLRTNLLWMSGVIEVEGNSKNALHPKLGEIVTDASTRRNLVDFPPVVWLTRQIEVPKCLLDSSLFAVNNDTGLRQELGQSEKIANAIALNRVALGFRISDIPAIPWSKYYGYNTSEGLELNRTARESGDNPDDWFISEVPIDLFAVAEFWYAPRIFKPKLVRLDSYVPDIHRMVKMCRETEGVYIPPSWLTKEQAEMISIGQGLTIAH